MTHRDGVTEMFVPGFQFESVAEKLRDLSAAVSTSSTLKIQLKFKYNTVQNQPDSLRLIEKSHYMFYCKLGYVKSHE